jgi:PAS domain S-box-containing protein
MGEFSQEWLCARLVAGSRDAVIFADPEGVIRLWNTGAAELFGYQPFEALGRPLDLIIPENLRERHNQGYQQVMASGASKYTKELLAVPGLAKDGRRLSLEFTITLIRNEEGRLLGAAAIIRDVTDRWQREQELKRRLAALEAGRVFL